MPLAVPVTIALREAMAAGLPRWGWFTASDGRHRARAARTGRVPPPCREDPGGLLLRRLLQLREGDARARRSPPARADAGLPAQGVDPRRRGRGARRDPAVRRPAAPRRLVGGRLGP